MSEIQDSDEQTDVLIKYQKKIESITGQIKLKLRPETDDENSAEERSGEHSCPSEHRAQTCTQNSRGRDNTEQVRKVPCPDVRKAGHS